MDHKLLEKIPSINYLYKIKNQQIQIMEYIDNSV